MTYIYVLRNCLDFMQRTTFLNITMSVTCSSCGTIIHIEARSPISLVTGSRPQIEKRSSMSLYTQLTQWDAWLEASSMNSAVDVMESAEPGSPVSPRNAKKLQKLICEKETISLSRQYLQIWVDHIRSLVLEF